MEQCSSRSSSEHRRWSLAGCLHSCSCTPADPRRCRFAERRHVQPWSQVLRQCTTSVLRPVLPLQWQPCHRTGPHQRSVAWLRRQRHQRHSCHLFPRHAALAMAAWSTASRKWCARLVVMPMVEWTRGKAINTTVQLPLNFSTTSRSEIRAVGYCPSVSFSRI